MAITYCLMEKLEEIADKEPERARVLNRAKVTRLLRNEQGEVTGVVYTQ